MKSIKPGRGPSMMGGIASLCMVAFGLIWTVIVASSGIWIMALFGVIFIVMGIVQAVYNFKNATSKNRFSTFDITEGDEEPDPLEQRWGEDQDEQRQTYDGEKNYCPYCGTRLEEDFEFCPKCGKRC